MIWGFIVLLAMALAVVWTIYSLIEYDERRSNLPGYKPTELRLSLQELKKQFVLLKAMLKEKFRGKNAEEKANANRKNTEQR